MVAAGFNLRGRAPQDASLKRLAYHLPPLRG